MKSLKKFLFVFLVLTLAFCLFACGGGNDPCKTHVDKDNDGKCDKCSETIEGQPAAKDVVLVEDGEANFQIVYANGLSTMVNGKVGKMKTTFAGLGIDVDRVLDKADNAQDCEILIGNVTTRGDKYFVDGHDYGMEGYVIKIIDSKIIINAGSDEMLIEAIDKFLEDIIEIDNDEKDFENLVMLATQQVEEIQDGYKITSLSVDGKDMKGYTLAVDKSNTYHMEAAELLQETLYERAGYWFEIVEADKASDTSVIVKAVAKNAVDGGFKISTNSKKQLVIECGYDNALKTTVEEFISDKIIAVKGAIDFNETVYTKDVSVVYYKDFGAVGNGTTDDFFAIKAAHDFANISGQTVKAEKGKTYYICETRDKTTNKAQTIIIKTNVDWCNAKFIIDDTNVSVIDGTGRNKNIFNVASDYENTTINNAQTLSGLAGIGEGTTKLNLKLGYPALITIYNDNHKVYRRYGYSQQDGEPQSEILLIDAEGNIDESTPFMFDYEEVTSVKVHRVDVEPITVKNGVFTTRASQTYFPLDNEPGTYMLRGMSVTRPGTVVENVEHYVTDELPWTHNEKAMYSGAAWYRGFFTADGTNDVLFKDCVLTGRRAYSHSSYDFKAEYVNNVRLLGCTQSNFYLRLKDDGTTEPACDVTFDEETGVPTVTPHEGKDVYVSMASNPEGPYQFCWGIAGTNYSKNVDYINCVLSRYDAHCGVLNGKVVGTTINTFALVGKGDFLIEDATWISSAGSEDNHTDNSFIYLRGDYGSPWNGTITIKDTKADGYATGKTWLLFHNYRNWYYGYTCHFPNIVVDNLNFTNTDTVEFLYDGPAWISRQETINEPTVKYDYDTKVYGTFENNNPVVPPEFVKIINNKSGENYNMPYDESFFYDTKFEIDTNGDTQPDVGYYQTEVYDGPISIE